MKISLQAALPVLCVVSFVRENAGQTVFCEEDPPVNFIKADGEDELYLCNGVPNGPIKFYWRTFCSGDDMDEQQFGIKVVSGDDTIFEDTSNICTQSFPNVAEANVDIIGDNLADWRVIVECLKNTGCDFTWRSVLVDCGCPPGQMVVSDCTIFQSGDVFSTGAYAAANANAVCAPEPTASPVRAPTNAPVAPPPPPTPPSTCFSEMTRVPVKNVDVGVPMKDIKIGDLVLTKSGSYQPVYAWGHVETDRSAEFLQIHTSDKRAPLEITENHMVFLQGRDGPVAAGKVNVGDVLLDVSDEGDRKVVKVSKITRSGLYAPLTPDGTIVVNGGLVASNYIDPYGDAGDEYMKLDLVALPLIKADMFHIWFSPLRMMCMGVSATACEYRNEEGIHYWAALGLMLAKFADEQKSFLAQLVIYATMIIVPVISMVVEVAVGPSLGPLVILFASVIAYKKWQKGVTANISVSAHKSKAA